MKMDVFSKFILTTVLATCFLFGFLSPGVAGTEVSGVVKEVGFNQFIMIATGSNEGVRYNTGRETKYSPGDYRALQGDTISINYYEKPTKNGGIMLAVSSLELKKSNPNRKDLVSPAIGVITEVGRAKIRIDYIEYNQTISWSKKRGMQLMPAGYTPQVGDKVEVSFEMVKNQWTGRSSNVISGLKKID